MHVVQSVTCASGAGRWEHGRGMTDARADVLGKLGRRPQDVTDDSMYGKAPPRLDASLRRCAPSELAWPVLSRPLSACPPPPKDCRSQCRPLKDAMTLVTVVGSQVWGDRR